MAKVAILAAVHGVLLVAATARTTTLMVEVGEEENLRRRGSSGSCWDQLQRAQMLSHCQDSLSEVSSRTSLRAATSSTERTSDACEHNTNSLSRDRDKPLHKPIGLISS